MPPSATGPKPFRVSRIRCGGMAVNRLPPATVVVSANQPPTSTRTFTQPVALKMLTCPPAPTGTITRLGSSCQATTLRLEVDGRADPVGNTDIYVEVVASVAVR